MLCVCVCCLRNINLSTIKWHWTHSVHYDAIVGVACHEIITYIVVVVIVRCRWNHVMWGSSLKVVDNHGKITPSWQQLKLLDYKHNHRSANKMSFTVNICVCERERGGGKMSLSLDIPVVFMNLSLSWFYPTTKHTFQLNCVCVCVKL